MSLTLNAMSRISIDLIPDLLCHAIQDAASTDIRVAKAANPPYEITIAFTALLSSIMHHGLQ